MGMRSKICLALVSLAMMAAFIWRRESGSRSGLIVNLNGSVHRLRCIQGLQVTKGGVRRLARKGRSRLSIPILLTLTPLTDHSFERAFVYSR